MEHMEIDILEVEIIHSFYRFRKIDVVCYKRTFFERNCAGVKFAVVQEWRIWLPRSHRDVTNLSKILMCILT